MTDISKQIKSLSGDSLGVVSHKLGLSNGCLDDSDFRSQSRTEWQGHLLGR